MTAITWDDRLMYNKSTCTAHSLNTRGIVAGMVSCPLIAVDTVEQPSLGCRRDIRWIGSGEEIDSSWTYCSMWWTIRGRW